MHAESWLRLTDYASKYRISISTLRRRIKHGQIAHRFEDGKYLILDKAPTFAESSPVEAPEAERTYLQPPQTAFAAIAQHRAEDESELLLAEAQARLDQIRESTLANEKSNEAASPVSADETVLNSAGRLMGELKRAYMNVLQEKEEQIIQLKEEVTDLKTLVRVLEDDNERLRRMAQGFARA